MNSELDELRVAAEIRKVATQIRDDAFLEWQGITKYKADSEVAGKWRAECPVSKYVPQAIAELRDIAALRKASEPD